MISAVGNALTSMIGWIGTFISNLVNAPVEGVGGSLYALLPLFAIGIAASLCMFAMKINGFARSLGVLDIPSNVIG